MVYIPPPISEKPQDTPISDLTTYAERPPTFLPAQGVPPPVPPVNISEPAVEEVWRLLNTVLANKSAYKTLLGLKDDKAQAMLDILHKVLDSQDAPTRLGHATLYATMRLCAASGAYPRCLALQEIRYEAKPVASGAFGDIWKGYHRNHPVSLKVARVYQGSDVGHLIKTYMREAIMWSHLNHPNVLPFYGIYQVDERLGCVCLVSPWMQNGNVNDYMKAHPEAPRLPLVHDILAGLSYLHERSIVHGDLKGANILISSAGSACLADFGLSSMIDSEILRWTSLKTMTRVGGTVRWQAPELMDDLEDDSRPTLPADIYSAASVMYEVFTEQIPFHEIRNDMTVMLRVIKGLRPSKPSPNQASELSPEIWEVMERCWCHIPDERPPVGQVVDKLVRINPTELTLKRMYVQKMEWNQDAEVNVPTAIAFRAAMRGQNANFSKAEVDLLREYAWGSSQAAPKPNTPLPSFDGCDIFTQTTALNTTAVQTTVEPNLGIRAFPSEATTGIGSSIPNGTQAVLETQIQSPSSYLPPEPYPVPFHTPMAPYTTGPNAAPALPIDFHRPPLLPQFTSQPFFSSPGHVLQPHHTDSFSNRGVHNDQSVLIIHPLLNGENLRFDLLFDLSAPEFEPVQRTTYEYHTPLSIEELSAPFALPALQYLHIVCDLIPQWPLQIGPEGITGFPQLERTSELPLISVGDVLEGLHTHFRQSISRMDWTRLSPEEGRAVARAYTTRYKALGPRAVEERDRGMRRIDYAKGNVWFGGLTRVRDCSDTFKLHLESGYRE